MFTAVFQPQSTMSIISGTDFPASASKTIFMWSEFEIDWLFGLLTLGLFVSLRDRPRPFFLFIGVRFSPHGYNIGKVNYDRI